MSGLLCKHALRVFNINEVFILPPQYITSRWTKYAKNGFYCEKKQINENETLKMQAARISRKATSVALKRSISKELLDEYEKAIDKLDREADEAISQRSEKVSGVSESANDDIGDVLKGKVSIRVPEVIKGKKKRTDVLENKKGKKGKKTNTAKKKKGSATIQNYFLSHLIFFWLLFIFVMCRRRSKGCNKRDTSWTKPKPVHCKTNDLGSLIFQ